MFTIDDQIKRLKELAIDLNLNIVEILEESKSAKAPKNRPIFEKMLNMIKQGKANGILCWKLDRLSRNPIDSGELQWMIQKGEISIIQTIERKYLPEDNVLLFSLESGMANQYSLDLAKNVKRGLQSKIEKGWYPQVAPIGYLNDKLAHTIIKDPSSFYLVRQLWDLMLTGKYTPPKILKIATNELGLRTKIGNKLSRSYIYKIFNNPFYI